MWFTIAFALLQKYMCRMSLLSLHVFSLLSFIQLLTLFVRGFSRGLNDINLQLYIFIYEGALDMSEDVIALKTKL